MQLHIRRGISLLEVLFSMLLVTVGLFGAIALLPVAAHQAKRGRTADAQAVAGEAAVSEFQLRQMGNATKWFSPVSNFFRANLVDSSGNPVNDLNGNQITTRFFPSFAYCIDPLFVASQGNTVVTKTGNGSSRFFPYYDLAAPTSVASSVRMERISLLSGLTPATAMGLQQAMSIFVSDDDLFVDRVKDASVPASQIYTRLGTTTNLRRLSNGELSWFATLVPRPKQDSVVAPEEYTLSIVVVNNRPLTTLAVETDDAGIVAGERLVDVVSFPGSGVSGGEMVFQFRGGGRTEKDLEITPGDWVMLSGSYAATNNAIYTSLPLPTSVSGIWRWEYYNTADNLLSVPRNLRPAFAWYRVVNAAAELTPGTTNQKEVTLSGGDWPAGIIANNATQATIVTGVVAVYEKTIRLNFK